MTPRRVSSTALRSAVPVLVVALVGAGAGIPARAEEPAAPSAPAPVVEQTETVSAVVLTDEGTEVVSREAEPDEVREVMAELRDEPGVLSVSVDTPVHATADTYRSLQWKLDTFLYADMPSSTPNGTNNRAVTIECNRNSVTTVTVHTISCTLLSVH